MTDTGSAGRAAETDARGLSPVAAAHRRKWAHPVVIGGAVALVVAAFWWFNTSSQAPVAVPPVAPAGVRMANELAEAAPPRSPQPPPVPLQQAPAPAPPPPKQPPIDEAAEMARRAPVMAYTSQRTASAPAPAPAARAAPPAAGGGIGAGMATTPVRRVKAWYLGDATYRLPAGAPVSCVLLSAIDSTLPGFVRCMVERDIQSANGALVVIDAGSVLLGEYAGGLKPGQERLGIIWSRVETPYGVAASIGAPATDPLGRTGVDGEVETYFWTRFGSALMFSLFQDSMSAGRTVLGNLTAPPGGTYQANPYQNWGGNTQSAGEQLAATALRGSQNIPPVIRKNQGERIMIVLRDDIDFSDVYGLEPR